MIGNVIFAPLSGQTLDEVDILSDAEMNAGAFSVPL
jgi:hypothetical protein